MSLPGITHSLPNPSTFRHERRPSDPFHLEKKAAFQEKTYGKISAFRRRTREMDESKRSLTGILYSLFRRFNTPTFDDAGNGRVLHIGNTPPQTPRSLLFAIRTHFKSVFFDHWGDAGIKATV